MSQDPTNASMSSESSGVRGAEFLESVTAAPGMMELAFPWAVSVMFHMGIGLLFLFVFFATRQVHRDDNDIEQIIVPVANLGSDPGKPGGVEHPGLGGDPTRDAAQDRIKTMTADGWADKPATDNNVQKFLGGGDAGESVAEGIFVGSGGSLGGTGKGGMGGGDGGPLAPFGTPGGGTQAGPKGSFYGTGGNAYKIVYILDRSGRMVATFASLRAEVSRSVNGLLPVQSFAIIMLGNYDDLIHQTNYHEAFYVGSTPSLLKATKENKAKIIKNMESVTCGSGSEQTLLPFKDSFEKAFALKPQLIYFLTDGGFDPKLLEVVRDLNKDRKTHVNTIAYGGNKGDDGTEKAAYREQLKQMAQENGGKFRHVSDDELGWN
jgi:hypothetical protein